MGAKGRDERGREGMDGSAWRDERTERVREGEKERGREERKQVVRRMGGCGRDEREREEKKGNDTRISHD